MKIDDIVTLKKYPQMLGAVTAIDELDRATIKLCDTGLELCVAICDLAETHSNEPQRESGKIVHILGCEYKILIIADEDYRIDKEVDGWCDTSTKEILICNFKQHFDSKRDLIGYQKKVIRHEIVHAFLYESGLDGNTTGCGAWAKNEELVDWIAIQMPKLVAAFKEAGVLEEV